MRLFSDLDDRFVNAAALAVVGDLVDEGIAGGAPLDAVVAAFLKARLKGAPDRERVFVVDAAHAIWRNRRLAEAIAAALPRDRRARTLGALLGLGLPRRAVADGFDVAAIKAAVDVVVAAAPVDVRASLPPWLCARLVARGGDALALSSTSPPPQTLRVNTLKATRDDVARALNDAGIATTPTRHAPHGLVVDGGRKNVFATQAFRDGLFEMQDEGSQLIAALAQAAAGQRVVDGCAGAGGKTLALAAAMQNKGTLIALDVHSGRLKALRERAARAAVSNLRVHDVEEEGKVVKRLRGSVDVVVIDAPCSGTGVLRRNPDTGWRLTETDVSRLVALQATLLRKYAPLVRPGGTLVYATCSLLDEENRAQVDAFLAESSGQFALAPARARLHAGGVDVDVDDVLALDPVGFGTDGFFAAALVRMAS